MGLFKNLKCLFIGMCISALGIAFVIQASLGAFPITALNYGVGNITHFSYGTSAMVVELGIILVNILNKEKIGIATLANATITGYIIDFFTKVIPVSNTVFIGIPYLILGMVIFSFGQYFITKAALGNGSSNGLMNILMKKTGKSVFVIRTCIEITFMILAFLLGGPIGAATIVLSFGCGYVMNTVYKLLKFKPEKVQHKYISFKRNNKINNNKNFKEYYIILNEKSYKIKNVL